MKMAEYDLEKACVLVEMEKLPGWRELYFDTGNLSAATFNDSMV